MNAFLDYLKRASLAQTGDGPLRVLGIDLGTTNSTVAEIVWSQSQAVPPIPHCLPIDQQTDEGRYTHVLVPSIVARLENRVLVGEGAKRLRARNSELGMERGRDLFWECKNDMGLQRTYHRAPQGFRSAKEIGGRVLRYLMDAVEADDNRQLDRVVVTVPASFQTAQRRDTIDAGRLARLELVAGNLVDEPLAAFLDYGFTHGLEDLGQPGQQRNLLVFDFGGGTCDVAVFRVKLPKPGDRLQIAPLAVSRYHRLGGGDIDAAIVYEVLLPQIVQQNHLGPFDLTYEDKKQVIEPAFLSVAEALKINLCKEINRLNQFGKYQEADKDGITVKNPGAHYCQLKDGRKLALQSPKLSAAQLLDVLKSFLDPDVLAPRESEFRLTCSIFAPLEDALDRSGMEKEGIDLCLLVGGSSLILPVQQAIATYFHKARLMTYENDEEIQTAVARGGAYHALFLAATGKGALQPIAGDAIQIQTDTGPVELIPKHTLLPYPQEGTRWAESKLAVPRSSKNEPVELRIELLNSESAVLERHVWQIPPPVRKGTPLLLRYRMDANQMLEVSMCMASEAIESSFKLTVENPLTNVLNPSNSRAEIDRLEERLKTNAVPRSQWPNELARLACLYEDLNQNERAFDLFKKAVRAKGAPDSYLLNRMGLVCDRLRDYEKTERFFHEADQLSNDGAPMFNLALSLKRRGNLAQAYDCALKALERERRAPYLVLQAQLTSQLKDVSTCEAALQESAQLFGPVKNLSDWELWWFRAGAELRGDQTDVKRVTSELQRRRSTTNAKVAGYLPTRNLEEDA